MKRLNLPSIVPALFSFKKKFFLTIIFYLVVNLLLAQVSVQGNWTWMKGSNTTNDTGSYGRLGVPDVSNGPRSRSGALTWTDASGLTWMYGGFSFTGFRHSQITLNDFWTYDPSSNNWTWIAGQDHPDQNIPVVYGQQGISAPGNTPGARGGCFTWIPGDGRFWFYDPAAAEIWNYNPLTADWTWMKGQLSPPVGVKGVPAETNTPGFRREPSCWKDNTGNIWVMGGMENSDDLWMYDRTTNNWTWFKGEISQVAAPVYGTYRTEDPVNTPGPRLEAFTWTDNHGDFWLQGGFLFYNASAVKDLWKFNFKTKNWAWIKGEQAGGDYPGTVYGTQGVEDEASNPGERGNGVTWVDRQNNLWLMGGIQFHSTLNELWRFNTTTLKWAWVRGAEEPIAYGDLPPRRSKASAWSDTNGNFWMVGGLHAPRVGGVFFYNDLWRFTANGIILAQNPLSFNARRMGSNALLSWEIADESGITGYNIQRLDDGTAGYKIISYAVAKTPSGQQPVYTYTDNNFTSVATYYRLQLQHKNGEISFSETRLVPGLDQQDNITIYPNPSAGQQITIQFAGRGSRSISLVSVNGVITGRWFNYSASLLQLQNLQAGVYMLQVENQNNKLMKTKKIVIVK